MIIIYSSGNPASSFSLNLLCMQSYKKLSFEECVVRYELVSIICEAQDVDL